MSRNGEVMFVDDEEGVRTSWQRFFQERGLETRTAPDGATAIDELSRRPADVVVADHRMPGKTGLELLEWLRERQPDTRFIMLTGYGDRRLEWQVRHLGAAEYLEKPVAPDVLAHAVDRALDRDRIPLMIPTVLLEQMTGLDVPAPAVAAEPAPPVEAAAEADPANRISAPAILGAVLAGPLLGLAFVMFLPVIGIGALIWVVARQIKESISPAES